MSLGLKSAAGFRAGDAAGNRISENLPCVLVGTFRNVSCTAILNCKHQFANVSSSYIVNKLVTEGREDVRFQATQDVISVARRFARRPPFPPFASDILKAALCLTLSCFGFPLPGLGFSFALRHRINAGGQLFASGEMTLVGLSEIYDRILAQRHQLLLAVETIAPAPQL